LVILLIVNINNLKHKININHWLSNKKYKYMFVKYILTYYMLNICNVFGYKKNEKNIKIIKYLNEYDINVKTIIDYLKSI